jgi:hypothetical protein
MVWRGGPMPPHYRIFEPSKAWPYNHIAFGAEFARKLFTVSTAWLIRAKTLIASI